MIHAAALLLLACAAPADDRPADGRVYELRIYHCNPGKLDALNTRFREHTTKLFEKHGMTNVGYWTPTDADKGRGDTLIYLLAFPSREAAERSWAAFRDDPEWKSVKAESEKDGVLVARVESIFLRPTDYSADPLESCCEAGETPMTYELRTYTASPGKMDDLNKRFREHTTKLFEKHGMTNVGYWLPVDSDKSAEKLIYLLAFPSREAAAASWKAFGEDPEWQRVYKASQPDGVPLAAKVESVFLAPTDYSPIK
jgi:hypothetical protein